MSATVTIAATELETEAAFEQYSDKLTAGKEFSSVSVLPGDLCGYSGQKLMGSLADKPGQAKDFRTGSSTSGPTPTTTWWPSTWRGRPKWRPSTRPSRC
jgi:hypothetical protein